MWKENATSATYKYICMQYSIQPLPDNKLNVILKGDFLLSREVWFDCSCHTMCYCSFLHACGMIVKITPRSSLKVKRLKKIDWLSVLKEGKYI